MGTDATAFQPNLVRTLLELHESACSCVVRVERGPAKKQLVVAGGVLACAESNQQEDHLAQVMLRMNLLEKEDLKQVSALMKGGKKSDEAVVLAKGLDGGSLESGVREQALTILASLLCWQGAEVRLFEGEGQIRRYRVAVPMPLALVEAARRAACDRNLPPPLLQLSGFVCPTTSMNGRMGLPLNSAEAYSFAQVSSPMPVQQALQLLPEHEAKPEELLRRLLLLGLVRLEAAIASPSSPARAAMEQIGIQVEERLQQFEVANLYEILSITPEAGEDEIKSAYHEMARLYHPDRFESGEYSAEFRLQVENLFTYITGAYTTLSDPARRLHYDEERLKKESRVEATLHGRGAADSERDKMAETLFRAGRAALKSGDYEKAIKQLRECVWLRPERARYHHYLGAAQAELPASRKDAEKHLLKAIELDQTFAESYLVLGKLYLKVHLPKRAEAQFLETLRWDPAQPEAKKLLTELSIGGAG